MNDPRLCPHCGYDLVKDAPIILNDFSMLSPVSPLCFRGHPLKLTGAEREIIWTVFKAFPRPVTIDIILDRLESESESNVIDVFLSRIRSKLREIGAPIPFEAVAGRPGRRMIGWKLT